MFTCNPISSAISSSGGEGQMAGELNRNVTVHKMLYARTYTVNATVHSGPGYVSIVTLNWAVITLQIVW